jgi:glucose/arabinose dehydrogenase
MTEPLTTTGRAGAPGPPTARRRGWSRAAVLLGLCTGLFLPGSAPATSLRFFGTGQNDIDRVKIRVDGPAKPADVGATDFTLEWWMRGLPGENASEAVGCDANDGWITGNIIFDRDVYGPGDQGDFGVSLTGGRVAFGVAFGSSGNTICGGTDVTDDAWHHVAVTRRFSDGRLRIYVDGVLDAEGPGNVGNSRNVSYRDGRTTAYPNSDPFLVIGAEKHDAGSAYPSYRGWIDEVRLSTVQRYTATTFTRPFSPLAPDGNTAALYHFDEGSGDVVGDASGGGSQGARQYGGNPAGPEWSSDAAPLDTSRRVALEQMVTGLTRPVAIAHAGDARLFVVEADGRILLYVVNGDGSLTFLDTFLDIQGLVLCCGERGLLGLAFHPDYATNRYFFVYYTAENGDGDIVIARYQARADDPNRADPDSARILLTIEHSTYGNHNGGALAFGPEGYLYAAIGDGGGGGDPLNSGQSLGTLLGKILRLDVDVAGDPVPHYEIPPDNPFVGTPGALGEIWAWGLRNPWRITFDRLTGDLFIADVGQGNREEVNVQSASSPGGENYGWRRMEGTACYNPSSGCQTGSLVLPILEYTHAEGCSITGGYRYRGAGVPTLHGVYLFGDFCNGTIRAGVQSGAGTWSWTDLLDTSLSISTFGEDAAGEVYVADLNGAIYRLVRAQPRLTVTRAGAGTGTVNGPGGIACGTGCSADYEPGTSVTLTATTAAGSSFAGWSGDCGGTGDCVVVMDGDRAVTATFNPRPLLQFSTANYTVSEGSRSVTITVQRLVATAGTVTVDYALAPGSATPPPAVDADFAGPGGVLSGTLTFGPGQASRTFTVSIVNDTRAEGPETILLALRNPTGGAVLGDQRTAVLTILDNDLGGVLKLSAAASSVAEGAGQVVLIISRSGGYAGNVSVDYVIAGVTATAPPDAGADFTGPGGGPLTGTLTFEPGMKKRTLTIPIVNDGAIEPNETFTVTLENAQGGATLASPTVTSVTIVDNDRAGTAQFSQATATAQEYAPSVTLTVTRTGSTSGAATVSYAITGDTAAVNGPLAGTVNFSSGQSSRPLVIPLANDSALDGNSTLSVTLVQPLTGGLALGTPNPGTVTLVDDEGTVQFSGTTFPVGEGDGSATIRVTRTGGTAQGVTVGYATGSPSIGTPATPSASPTVCTTGADYRAVSGTLVFNPGETSKTFAVPLCGDSVVEGAETVGLTLSVLSGPAQPGSPATATLTIEENSVASVLRFSSATYAVTEGTETATLTVLRTNGAVGGITTPWSITGGTAILNTDFSGPTSGTFDFGTKKSSAPLVIPILDDTFVDGPRTVVVTLGAPTGGAVLGSPSVATLTIGDNEPTVRFSSATYTVSEGSPTVGVTVQRLGPKNTPAEVTVQTTATGTASGAASCGAGIDFAAVSVLVTFLPGQSSKPVTITLCPDTQVDGSETIELALTDPVGATLATPNTATVTITENDVAGTLQFAVATTSVSEAQGTASVLVTRTGGSASAVTVDWTITGGTAVHGADLESDIDYTGPTGGTLTFALNQMSQALTIPVVDRAGTQGARTITLLLDGAGGGSRLGPQTTATLWILDAD